MALFLGRTLDHWPTTYELETKLAVKVRCIDGATRIFSTEGTIAFVYFDDPACLPAKQYHDEIKQKEAA